MEAHRDPRGWWKPGRGDELRPGAQTDTAAWPLPRGNDTRQLALNKNKRKANGDGEENRGVSWGHRLSLCHSQEPPHSAGPWDLQPSGSVPGTVGVTREPLQWPVPPEAGTKF